METLSNQLINLNQQALLIINNFLNKHNGKYIHADIDTAFNEDNGELENDFINSSYYTIIDTQSEINEDVYFRAIENDLGYIIVTMVDTQGEDHRYSLMDYFLDSQLLELADFIAKQPHN